MKITWLKNIIKTKSFSNFVGNLAYYYLKFVGLTTRWQAVINVKKTYETLEKDGSMIVVGWHGRTLEMPYFWNKTRTLNALVSPHRDGQYIVNILAKFGIGHISGSSNQNSTEAAFELMHNLQQGNSIAIIPDGPRGPSMQMTMSPIFYAQKSGKPIIGITYSIANSIIVTKSWDNMMIPFPFQKGIYAITDPIYIPQDATAEELEQYRLKVEQTLNNLTWELDQKMGIQYIPQGTECKRSRKEIKQQQTRD
ncbi:MAG: lysophospholipid acyltransferase family protein [Alphaproteobacteria bacterium]|nr:lysophospholipid acyltransferase family protein [Alphaproteobacteria bacterium]